MKSIDTELEKLDNESGIGICAKLQEGAKQLYKFIGQYHFLKSKKPKRSAK